MSSIVISDLKPIQSKCEKVDNLDQNVIVGGGDLDIKPYIKPSYDFSSSKLSVEVGVTFTIKF